MFINIYIYIYIYTYIYIYNTHIDIFHISSYCLFRNNYIHIRIYPCMYIHTYMQISRYIRIRIVCRKTTSKNDVLACVDSNSSCWLCIDTFITHVGVPVFFVSVVPYIMCRNSKQPLSFQTLLGSGESRPDKARVCFCVCVQFSSIHLF